MRVYRRLCAAAVVIFLLLAAVAELIVIKQEGSVGGEYRVEAKRLADELETEGSYDLDAYPHLTGVYPGEGRELYASSKPYVIIEARGQLYRVEYRAGKSNAAAGVGLVLLGLFVLLCGVLWYIGRHVILPFRRIDEVPRELARGNLAVPIPEERGRFLGKFTWGVNLLREKIEEDRQRELAMQRDKKLLLLSLSHDIKTPLSAIKLNAKALAKGLYTDEEKRRSAAESINSRADEIERFVSEITRASSEDFMSFEVSQGEVFLSEMIAKIEARYAAQLAATGTVLDVGKYSDCILSCDPDRLGECLQNLIENAIKYGDGRQILLTFDKVDGCELITVTNTGCTLEKKELPQLFESFHRGSNAEGQRGNGLGLFICKRLMSLMGGEVYAEIKGGCFAATLVVRLS